MKKKEGFEYRPFKNSFAAKMLRYLDENGQSSGVTIQEQIGLNAWADARGKMFFSRASILFDKHATKMRNEGLLEKLADDNYLLTAKGKLVVEELATKR